MWTFSVAERSLPKRNSFAVKIGTNEKFYCSLKNTEGMCKHQAIIQTRKKSCFSFSYIYLRRRREALVGEQIWGRKRRENMHKMFMFTNNFMITSRMLSTLHKKPALRQIPREREREKLILWNVSTFLFVFYPELLKKDVLCHG